MFFLEKGEKDYQTGNENSIGSEGTQLEFPFPNSGDPSGTPTDSKKKTKLLFRLNLFKSESVERTHLYSYVFH